MHGVDIDLLTAIGFKTGGINTVHIYTETIHRTTQLTLVGRLHTLKIYVTYLPFGVARIIVSASG